MGMKTKNVDNAAVANMKVSVKNGNTTRRPARRGWLRFKVFDYRLEIVSQGEIFTQRTIIGMVLIVAIIALLK